MENNNTINLEPIMESASGLINMVGSIVPAVTDFINNEDSCSGACPPKNTCPPNCLLTIDKRSYSGERIIVPFKVKNEHKRARTYKIGVRPLLDEQGQLAPKQPVLSTNGVTLQPGQSILVTMTLDLDNFATGSQYETEIVIREDKFNQNICFKLCVESYCNVPVARPWDENIAYKQFRGWQSHFTCTTKPSRDTAANTASTTHDTATSSGIGAATIK